MRRLTICLGSILLGLTSLCHARPTHIVILETSISTDSGKTANARERYQNVRQALDLRTSIELRPFHQDFEQDLRTTVGEVIYLPIISGIGMTLTNDQLRRLEQHPRVQRVIPNTEVYLDGALLSTPVLLPIPSSANLNEGLRLHKVSELIGQGIDLHHPGKTVGIIDTGVDGKHPDLALKIIRFKNFNNNSEIPTDTGSHGTHVSGIIAGGDASGIQLGVYPGAKLVVGAALNSVASMAEALQWMLDPDGDPETEDQPFVINNSWHIGNSDPTPFYQALQTLKDADILVCFSAGNVGTAGLTKPKEYPTTFTTAAVNAQGIVATFSSRGPAIYQGEPLNKPEVSSMGVDVISTLPGRYGKMSGTSMASPFTAGAIALLGAHFPNVSPYEISEVLVETVDFNLSALWDRRYGYGLINVARAFQVLAQRYP